MKKILIFSLFILSSSHIRAEQPPCITCFSSYTEVASPASVLFTSATIRWVGITISSPGANSLLALYRSTSPSFTADISTAYTIATDYNLAFNGPTFIPFPYIKNSTYTYINKVGNAKLIYWYECQPSLVGSYGLCPGQNFFGK